ncbi:MAG: hypothetical protein ACTMIR_08465 [Cellulomonadaceae bacterium]
MTWSEIVVIAVVVLGAIGVWVWQLAVRLDRLHRKVVASRIALDAQLVRRAGAARELATSGELDPASSMLVADAVLATAGEAGVDLGDRELIVAVPDLANVVHRGRAPATAIGQALGAGLGAGREAAESNLSAVLREALDDPEEVAELRESETAAPLLEALASAWYRVQLARRFHNEAVAQAQRVRAKPVIRALRLAGKAAMPRTVDLDDTWTDALGRPGEHASAS